MTKITSTKVRNPHRIPVAFVARNEGFDSIEDMLNSVGFEAVVPACCDEGCSTEPDGTCEHGCPSILLALGII